METIYFEQVAHRISLPLSQALRDPFFYHLLRLDKYQDFEDLNGKWSYTLDLSQFHQFELWSVEGKKQKFTLEDIHPDRTLFPLYSTIESSFPNPVGHLTLTVKEKGRALYNLKTPFNLLEQQLSFSFCSQLQLLHTIYLNHQLLLPEKRDTVVVG